MILNSFKYLAVIICALLLVSCGKKDNSEFIDEKPKQELTDSKETPKQETKQETKSDTSSTQQNTSSDKSTENTNRQSFQNEKPVAVISPLEAGDYNGKTVTVKGFVADIYQNEKVAYLNFVKKYPDHPFTAVIFARQFSDFPDIERLRNKDVEVTGRVSIYKGKPQIILNSPSQLKTK